MNLFVYANHVFILLLTQLTLMFGQIDDGHQL